MTKQTTPDLDLTLGDIRQAFSKVTFPKGFHYYKQGRVLEYNLKGKFLESKVRGSHRHPYTQQISVSKGNIGGSCSCPMGWNCKHVVAVLCAAVEASKPVTDTEAELLDPMLDKWLQSLAHEEKIPEKVRHRLVYLLKPKQWGRIEVHFLRAYLRKDGSYGKTSSYHFELRFNQPSYMLDKDVEIHRMAQAITTSYHSGCALQGKAGAMMLEQIVSTGRAHWGDLDSSALSWVEPEQGALGWAIDEKGGQRLVGKVREGSGEVFAMDPPCFVDLETGEAGRVIFSDSVSNLEGLLTGPVVGPSQVASMSQEFARVCRTETVPAPLELEVHVNEDLDVHPILTLSCESVRSYYDGGNDVTMARLSFQYGDIQVDAHATGPLPNRYDGKVVMKATRQEKFEQEIIGEIFDLGFLPFSEFRAYHLSTVKHGNALVLSGEDIFFDGKKFYSGDEAWEHFASEVMPRMKEEGWEIVVDPSFPWQILPEPDAWFVDIDDSSGFDWFDLELGVEIEGEKISLLPILINFVKDRANDLDEIIASDAEKVQVTLDGNRRVLMPGDFIRRVLSVLRELHLTPKDSSDKLRLSKFDAERLVDLEEALPPASWKGGEEVRALAKKLREFKGIATFPQPAGLKTQLRDYQKEGLSWLQFLREHNLAGILADDMGLGKTVQLLSYLLAEKEAGRLTKPALVVAPTSVLPNWIREAERFSPSLDVLSFYGQDRRQHEDKIPSCDLLLTTYRLLHNDRDLLVDQPFHSVILDEAQNIKNANSQVAKAACRLQAGYRFCMTGTPMENHLGELWSLFNFLAPGLLGDKKSFAYNYRVPIEKQGDKRRQQELARKLRPLMLRRTKDAVVKELPKKTEIRQLSTLRAEQRQLYESIRSSMHKRVLKEIDNKGLARSHIVLLDALLKLRQVCCHPTLVKAEAAKGIDKSAKFDQLMEMLPELIEEGRRVLVFSQFTSMLKLIEEACEKRGIPLVKLTGKTRNRATPVEQFQSGEIPLFLLSLKAGGTGLNLTAADAVIHYDPWWNPAAEAQATDRAHRIGQDKPVFVYKMISAGTVEEKIVEMQDKKQSLADAIFDPNASKISALTAKDIDALFQPN